MPTVARDLSRHGKLILTGADRARFLHGMVTSEVKSLRPGEGCHACMLTIKGKLLGDLRIYVDAEALLLETDPLATDKIRDALARHIIMDDVVIEDHTASLGELGVWGDGARAAVEALVGELPDLPRFGHVVRDGVRVASSRDLGRAGFRLFGELPALLAKLDLPLLSDDAAEVLRVEAGEPRYGVDMGEDHLPIESRLDDAISTTKGCYLGQEVIVRATQQGRINRRLMGLRLAGDEAVAPGTKLGHATRAEAGVVTSSALSPRFGAIALGYVHRTVFAPGTELVAHAVGGDRAAVVTELPFA